MGVASGGLLKKWAEGQWVVLRTRYLGVHILHLAAKSISDGNGRTRSVFHRNFSQTGIQRDRDQLNICQEKF